MIRARDAGPESGPRAPDRTDTRSRSTFSLRIVSWCGLAQARAKMDAHSWGLKKTTTQANETSWPTRTCTSLVNSRGLKGFPIRADTWRSLCSCRSYSSYPFEVSTMIGI